MLMKCSTGSSFPMMTNSSVIWWRKVIIVINLDVSGELIIPKEAEREIYLKQKELNVPMKKTFFLFQAQKLNLPETKSGQVLKGHIIESAIGDYDPKNVIVREAQIIIKKVHINLINPFFVE